MSYPTPELPPPADPLGETLHLLRPIGTLYCQGAFSAPFGIAIPDLSGVMTFLVVMSGRCWVESDDGERCPVTEGELVLIPHGRPHVISSDPSVTPARLFDLPVEKVSDRYERMVYGGGGEVVRTMYGVVRFDDVAAQNLIRLLPSIIRIDAGDGDACGWLNSTVRFIAAEAAALRPGGETVITRLADIVVIQAIRAWLDRAPEADQGWLAALKDRQIGGALALVHRAPERAWSVDALARQVGMSRSAFAARFADMVGQSPMRYVTWWRMQLARARLLEGKQTISAIAAALGYESEAAFGRAFKRVFGLSPGGIRRQPPPTLALTA